ncbi:hypothetical protein BCR39DRAFT_532444 [Naematelia encephala]|uniref:Zn(2)-C6 fungal-type domain-containing protein n=1 Tax=Naematelia encephala TaxID=71784 RepID=A0A1Y2B471_9TREE|nr:hypothetical protein BCR39DRAFT_532444 [Naematelia encephala]
MDPSFDSLLEDDTFQPLKRNHACLQCKKRKVKCDATRPTCSPCMRSHAHAIRAAQRNKTAPPPITCTYADVDSPEASQSPPLMEVESRRESDGGRPRDSDGARKKSSGKRIGETDYRREKDIRREEEREQLLARIADLESRLAGMTPSNSSASSSRGAQPARVTAQANNAQVWVSDFETGGAGNVTGAPGATGQVGSSSMWVPETTGDTLPNQNATPDWDFGGLFMVPLDWPKNLPSPILLEHLIDTFFTQAPQLPRILHRGRLMSRLRLPPSHPDFPHASLLHAICAAASTHTAWVNNLPPEVLENTILRHKQMNVDMENIEDFALAQAASAQRSIRTAIAVCLFGPGRMIFEILQATVILSDVYFSKGLPLEGWLTSGHPARLMKALELTNKNQPKRYKEPLYPDAHDDIEREERLATVWMAFVLDSGFSVNSYWSQSFDLSEMRCGLPTSAAEFNKKDEFMLRNPQSPESPDLMTNHPISDSFVLTVKASILLSRTARWLRDWQQRDIVPGDDLDGLKSPEYSRIITDIYNFQTSIPIALKNVFRIVDQTSAGHPGFDASLLMVHILPNIALCLINEPFVDWRAHINSPLTQVQKSYEAMIGVLHLIPSNLDVSLIFTSLLAFCLYTGGRIIANFVQRAIDMQQFGLAVRYRADLSTVQNLLDRFGMKQSLGQMMSRFLEQYLRLNGSDAAVLAFDHTRLQELVNADEADRPRKPMSDCYTSMSDYSTAKDANRSSPTTRNNGDQFQPFPASGPGWYRGSESSSSNPTPPLDSSWVPTIPTDLSGFAAGRPENQNPVQVAGGSRISNLSPPSSGGDDSSKASPVSWMLGMENTVSTDANATLAAAQNQVQEQDMIGSVTPGEARWETPDVNHPRIMDHADTLYVLGPPNVQGLSVKNLSQSMVEPKAGQPMVTECSTQFEGGL